MNNTKLLLAISIISIISSNAFASQKDELVYKALTVKAIPAPTIYPNIIYVKSVGGLNCQLRTLAQLPGVMAVVPVYTCTLAKDFSANPDAIFDALNSAIGAPPTVYGEQMQVRAVGSINCQKIQLVDAKDGRGRVEKSANCRLE